MELGKYHFFQGTKFVLYRVIYQNLKSMLTILDSKAQVLVKTSQVKNVSGKNVPSLKMSQEIFKKFLKKAIEYY